MRFSFAIPHHWARFLREHSLSRNRILKKAPSYDADKEFDWGGQSLENLVHSYCSISPYWAAYG